MFLCRTNHEVRGNRETSTTAPPLPRPLPPAVAWFPCSELSAIVTRALLPAAAIPPPLIAVHPSISEPVTSTGPLVAIAPPPGGTVTVTARVRRSEVRRTGQTADDASAVLTQVRKQEMKDADKADLCAEFQAAIVEVLAAKALAALKATGLKQLVVAGGVGANRALRAALDAGMQAANARVFYPELELCTDNGAMIAFAGAQRLTLGSTAKTAGSFGVRPRWALEEV